MRVCGTLAVDPPYSGIWSNELWQLSDDGSEIKAKGLFRGVDPYENLKKLVDDIIGSPEERRCISGYLTVTRDAGLPGGYILCPFDTYGSSKIQYIPLHKVAELLLDGTYDPEYVF